MTLSSCGKSTTLSVVQVKLLRAGVFVRLFFLMLHMPPVTKQFFHPHRKERSKGLTTLLGKRYMIINFLGGKDESIGGL